MTITETIQHHLLSLPPEKQAEVFDFVLFLEQRQANDASIPLGLPTHQSLREHPAFGAWKGRNLEGVEYTRLLRKEWDERA
ncbi:MAG: hypothetical protein Q7S51_12225 [Gallionellaceae bacterium]|nr:hypothetical protein [Gallionellaceae bacterium]